MKLYADVNFNGLAVRAIRRLGVDVMVAKEDGQGETEDPALLDRASLLGRALLTHDGDFLVEATRRQREGIPFVGVVYSHQERVSVGKLVEDLLLIAEATDESEWRSRVQYLPL